jgi:hypothetical protein
MARQLSRALLGRDGGGGLAGLMRRPRSVLGGGGHEDDGSASDTPRRWVGGQAGCQSASRVASPNLGGASLAAFPSAAKCGTSRTRARARTRTHTHTYIHAHSLQPDRLTDRPGMWVAVLQRRLIWPGGHCRHPVAPARRGAAGVAPRHHAAHCPGGGPRGGGQAWSRHCYTSRGARVAGRDGGRTSGHTRTHTSAAPAILAP